MDVKRQAARAPEHKLVAWSDGKRIPLRNYASDAIVDETRHVISVLVVVISYCACRINKGRRGAQLEAGVDRASGERQVAFRDETTCR